MDQDIAAILQPMTPQPAPVPEVQPAAPEQQADAQPPAPAPEPPKPTPQVPLPELLETRHRAQMAERENQLLREQMAMFQRSIEAQQQPVQQQQPPLDPVGDPEGFARAMLQENAHLRRQLQTVAENMPAHITEHLIREKYGDEAVDAAVKAAHEAGLGGYFMKQKSPYKSLMEWRNNQTIAQQIGPDLKAWETKKEAEIEARILAKHGIRQPAPVPQNIPPSLSTATRANGAVPVVESANDFFKSLFQPKAR